MTTVDEILQAVTSILLGCPEELHYSLVDGNTISITPARGSPSQIEQLSGTFTVIRARPYVPNTVFAFVLTDVAFEAASGIRIRTGSQAGQCSGFDIDAGIGCIEISTFEPDRVRMHASLRIDSNELGLGGDGPAPANTDFPSFENLEICGAATDHAVSCFSIQNGAEAGYDLRIFAVTDPSEVPVTPTPSIAPTTETPTSFRLAPGSTIEYMPSDEQPDSSEEPLQGSFLLGRNRLEPNAAVLDVLNLDLGSQTFRVTLFDEVIPGTVHAPFLNPGLLIMEVDSLISGQAVSLSGSGTFECCEGPALINALTLTGGSPSSGRFTLVIFANQNQ